MRPNIVLVRPIYPRNIGACSRAMANMGGGELILIAPQCEINHEARQGAAGAQQRLMEAKSYESIEQFLNAEADGLRIGFSGKIGANHDKLNLNQRFEWIKQHRREFLAKPIYFMFGPEDLGLDSEDLKFMNYVHSLPCAEEFSSMNLSQAVMLALFIFSQQMAGAAAPQVVEKGHNIDSSLENWLVALGFESTNRRRSALTVLRRTLLENAPTPEDNKVLEAIIQQTIRKLKEK